MLPFVYNGAFGTLTADEVEMCERCGSITEMIHVAGHTRTLLFLFMMRDDPLALVKVWEDRQKPIMPRRPRSRCYTTLFHPTFVGGWSVYDKTRRNTAKALTRITNCRGPAKLPDAAYEARLRRNQKRALTRGAFSHVFRGLLWQIRERVTAKCQHIQDVIAKQEEYASSVHPKRQLRLKSWAEIIDKCELDGLFTKTITGKVKLMEKAKPGKYPRLIGDYTCPGSLLGGFLCEIIKKCFLEVLTLDGRGRFAYMASIEPEFLSDMATELFCGRESFYGVFFSDDSIFRMHGRVFEMDISSCDMSNTTQIFRVVQFLASGHPFASDVIRKNIDQNRLPLIIPDPENRSITLKLYPAYPIEFSGTTLTTLLNNVASLLIQFSIFWHDDASEAGVLAAAESVGYKVTVSERKLPEEAQFLKHSFYQDSDGKFQSFLNLGAILRSFGSCDRDSCRDAAWWNASVLAGYKHSGRSSIQIALENKYPFVYRKLHRLPYDQVKHFSVGVRPDVPDEVICKRYKVTPSEIQEVIEALRYGNIINTSALQKIYRVDYGL